MNSLTKEDFDYAIEAIEEKIENMKETVQVSEEFDIDCTETKYKLEATQTLLSWIKDNFKINEN